jgi:uncharacterized damage-inducible protein DinB
MKQYLFDTFNFNSQINLQMLEKIRELPDKEGCVRYFSHLINSQNKWLARILQYPAAQQMSWWDPVYKFAELETEWQKSLDAWFNYLNKQTEETLLEEITFSGYDGGQWAAKPKDIALQLNYHAIHHRANMQMLIREQGLEPDFIDYIGTVYRKIA